jgi:hypothetical protein
MAVRGRPVFITDFSGGLDLASPALDMPLNRSPDLSDVVPFSNGIGLTQRDGDTLYFTSVSTKRQLYYFAGANRVLAVTDAVVGDITATGTPTTQANTSGNDVAFVEASQVSGQGPLFFIIKNSVTPTKLQWNGDPINPTASAWTAASGTIPTPDFMLYAGRRIWAFGDCRLLVSSSLPTDSAPAYSTIVFSDIGDPRTWPSQNTLQLGPGDGERIVAAGRYGDYIVVFKKTRSWLIYDFDTGANRPLTFGTGCIGQASVAETPYGLFFIDPDQGPLIFAGSEARLLENSERLGFSWWKTGTINSACYWDDSILVTRSDGTIFQYDFKTKAWWRHTGMIFIAPMFLDSGYPQLFAITSATTRVVKFMASGVLSRDTGTAIAPRWTTPWLTFGDPQLKKRYSQAVIEGAGDVTITGRLSDATTTAFTRGPQTLDATAPSSMWQVNSLGVGRTLQLQLDGTGTTRPLRLQSLAVYPKPRAA